LAGVFVLQKLQIYLTDSIGSSVRSLGLTATDMQQICTDLDIETVEEFLEFYPFPNQRIRGYVEEFFSGKGEELFYGQDEDISVWLSPRYGTVACELRWGKSWSSETARGEFFE
jgi:hypothetical protein